MMKRFINAMICLIALLTIGGCSSDIELKNYIDFNAPFLLTITPTDSIISLDNIKSVELEVNSEKWRKLVEWGKINQTDWHYSPASFIGNAYVTQGDFKLIHTRDSRGVVITFIDKEGGTKQYSKGIKKGELDFLFD